VFLVTYNNLLN